MTRPVRSPKDTITSFQAAEILRCSSNTINRLCAAGKLPHWFTGTHRRLSRKAVEAYARSQGIPLPGRETEWLGDSPKPERTPVVMVAAYESAEPFLEAATAGRPGLRWSEGSPLQIAHLAGSDPPTAVLIGCDNGLGVAVSLATILLATPNPPAVGIVLGDDADPWDDRLGAVRSRLRWLGTTPATWDGVLVELGLLPRKDDAQESEAAGEPGSVVAPR